MEDWLLADFQDLIIPHKTTSSVSYFDTTVNTVADLLVSFTTTGLQASQLSHAYQIIKHAASQREQYSTFLSATSSVILSGVRNIIIRLCELGFIQLLSLPFCAIEADIIQALRGLYRDTKECQDGLVSDSDILIPFMSDAIKAAELAQKNNFHFTPQRFIHFLGEYLNNQSLISTCSKKRIPIFCPAITDCKSAQLFADSNLVIDLVGDTRGLNRAARISNQLLTICLGGGVSKHQINKASIFNDRGADSAVYFINGEEFDGSDSGASPLEAMACGKLKIGGDWAKVHGECSIGFSIVGAQIIKDIGEQIPRNNEDLQETYWQVLEDSLK
ncbi:Deoxyhypusine synthase [Spironucleus salmonicida]|uniref:Deoxyhypusine synthase n=1 Tax=Spironucleus salmonicida TaxID=348837 RepID=V6LUG1_9EUKA|nr:Deoxyhypusine synthase [Spironucleus salmonicida]|eukprot:EST48205.1 Deoxyhypusine synthase [Spironucleus salmonicida]